MYKTWNLSFDFKPTSNLLGWRTFVHITDAGPGDIRRVLSIWLTPSNFGSQAMEARMHYEFDGSGNNAVIPVFFHAPLGLNVWNTFSMSQTMRNGKYYFAATVNNIGYSEINGVSHTNQWGQPELENTNPIDHPNVKLFSSTTATGPPTEGSLRNLQFCSEPPGMINLFFEVWYTSSLRTLQWYFAVILKSCGEVKKII